MEKYLRKELYLPIAYLVLGYLIYKLIASVIHVTLKKRQVNLDKNSYNYKKIETFKSLLINILKIIITVFVVLSILPIFGMDVSSLLAGLGIVSAVIALALQDSLKDLIIGLSITLENQFALGDTVSIGGFKGEVISMGLKTTRIRNFEGEVKIIANRNITEVINHSCSFSLAIVDISVSYEDDIEKIETLLNDLASKLSKTLDKLKGPIEVLGIQELGDSAVKFRMTVKTKSGEQFQIKRKILKEVKLLLDQENIKIPYPQIEVHHGE